MPHHLSPALTHLDAEVDRLARPRAWARVQTCWADDPSLAFATPATLLALLRGSGAETDRVAGRLAQRAAGGDHAALTLLLAAVVGVFVAVARRRADSDEVVADQLSLGAEVVRTSPLPEQHVLAVLVSRVQSRHRRLRRRTVVATASGERLAEVPASEDPARLALARLEIAALGGAVRRHIRDGAFTTDDWRRLVELRVHHRTSAELARAEAMSAAAVRKRAQRTADVLAVSARRHRDVAA